MLRSVLIVLSVLLFFAPFTVAEPTRPQRNREFEIPAKLRPRVEFWIDIFGRYGKAQVIIHHRRFPQIRFALLDVAPDTRGMNDVEFDSYKSRALKAALKSVRDDIAVLATGAAPQTAQQRNINNVMRAFGPGLQKYKRILDDPELVRGQSGIREKTLEAIQRSGRYLPLIEDIFVREYNLPVEVTRLPFVESSFDYRAYSTVAAAGIWQFMPNTAKKYMIVSSAIDERLDPIESSRAAAQYLKHAYARLGTWPLAITSYNHGVAGVLKRVRTWGTADISALIENGAAEPPFGFASGNFFPSFLAANHVYENRARFFPGVALDPTLRLTSIRLAQPVSIQEVQRRLGTTEAELRAANYALSERIWNGRANLPVGYNLKVPSRYSARLEKANFGQITEDFGVAAPVKAVKVNDVAPLEPIVPTRAPPEPMRVEVPKQEEQPSGYKVKPGDTLHSIAQKFNVSVDALKKANGLKKNAVFVGKVLKLPSLESQTESNRPAKKPSQAPALTRLYTVRKGDTLSSIAKKYKLSVSAIAERNGMTAKKASLKPGQVLKIP